MEDPELSRMLEFERFKEPVGCLLGPLLRQRSLVAMPCKHVRTFETARQARCDYFEDLDQDPDDDDAGQMPKAYCDCNSFNRRNELWEIAELCVKRSLTRQQMSEIAAIVTVLTTDVFTFNHVHRAMMDLFCGEHKDFLKAVKRQRDKGNSFAEAMPGLVARWQWRMMPNA